MDSIIKMAETVVNGVDPLSASIVVLLAGFFMNTSKQLMIRTVGALAAYLAASKGLGIVLDGKSAQTVIDGTMAQFLTFKVSTFLVYFSVFAMAIFSVFSVKTVVQK
jgi:hypothetical protein